MENNNQEINQVNRVNDKDNLNNENFNKAKIKPNNRFLFWLSISSAIIVVLSILFNIIYLKNEIKAINQKAEEKISQELGVVHEEIDSFKDEIKQLEEKNTGAEEKLNELESSIDANETSIYLNTLFIESANDKYKNIVFDLAETRGYRRLDSNAGIFFVLIDNVEKHLDGYKIYCSFGNPQNCDYNGFDLTIKWGEEYDLSNSKITYDEWEKSLKEKQISLTDDLKHGTWNKVSINISPVKPEEIHYVEFSMETDRISLK